MTDHIKMRKLLYNSLTINYLHIFFIGYFLFAEGLTIAQTVEVNPTSASIKDKSLKGFVVCLELDLKNLEKNWNRYLTSLGKFESVERQALAGMAVMLPTISSDAIDFYSKITVSPRCVQVFMGALRAGSDLELSDNQKDNVKKMLYDFAIEQYRQDLMGQMSEAERVENLAVKAHDKRTSEGENLKIKLKRNRKERANLQKMAEANAVEFKKLQTDSIQNVADRETALEEINKVRKIEEEKKQKLNLLK